MAIAIKIEVAIDIGYGESFSGFEFGVDHAGNFGKLLFVGRVVPADDLDQHFPSAHRRSLRSPPL